MAQTFSFDVTTGVELQEVDNAVNQAQKEIAQRYDFKGSKASIEFKRSDSMLVLVADDDFKMRALFDVLQTKLIKRGVPVKNLDIGETKPAGGDTVRREIKLKTALDGETAKKVAAAIKDAKLKKVQAAIQADQVRVTSPSKDELQAAMAMLRGKDFDVELLIPELEAMGLIDEPPVAHPGVRLFTGELAHVRYLKISEGCDHGCAF